VHLAKIALATISPAPWIPPPCIEHHGEEVHAHPPTGVGALPTLLLPFVFHEGGSTASQGPTSDWVRVDYQLVNRDVTPPFPHPLQDVRWAATVSGDVHLAVMRNS